MPPWRALLDIARKCCQLTREVRLQRAGVLPEPRSLDPLRMYQTTPEGKSLDVPRLISLEMSVQAQLDRTCHLASRTSPTNLNAMNLCFCGPGPGPGRFTARSFGFTYDMLHFWLWECGRVLRSVDCSQVYAAGLRFTNWNVRSYHKATGKLPKQPASMAMGLGTLVRRPDSGLLGPRL